MTEVRNVICCEAIIRKKTMCFRSRSRTNEPINFMELFVALVNENTKGIVSCYNDLGRMSTKYCVVKLHLVALKLSKYYLSKK